MKSVQIVLLLALAAVVGLPFLLRQRIKSSTGVVEETLVIITPHNEALRYEFGRGFQRWYAAKTGRKVGVDWRVIGGTSEIARYLEGEYTTSFQNHWTGRLGRPWSARVQAAYQNPRLSPEADAESKEARAEFLRSSVGCGIDLFFGGGPFDFAKQAQAGRLVDSGMLQRHPEWFTDEIIPRAWQGEAFWDPEGRWIGTVLSNYGILSNRDGLARLGMKAPEQWADLGDPRFFGELALADPTKSGSIAKAFENLVQQQMQRVWQAKVGEARDITERKRLEQEALREGWKEGLNLLQRMGANARYFSDSAQKPPIDVAQGNATVGVCIDFFGRQQAEAVTRRGADRLLFVTPRGGTVSSVDPIGLLRGAPHPELGKEFMEFVLSMEGQRLWNYRVGVEGGTSRYALRRLPVRRDFYRASPAAARSDPGVSPYEAEEPLLYRPEWTGGVFRELAFIIRIMCLDTHPELRRAWRAVANAGMPPQAMARLFDVSAVGYDEAFGRIKAALSARDRVEEIRLANELGSRFREQYLEAEKLAEASVPPLTSGVR